MRGTSSSGMHPQSNLQGHCRLYQLAPCLFFHTLSISSVAASLLAAISAAGRWAIVTNSVVFQNNDAPRAAKTLGTVGSWIQEGQKFCRKFEAVKWKKITYQYFASQIYSLYMIIIIQIADN